MAVVRDAVVGCRDGLLRTGRDHTGAAGGDDRSQPRADGGVVRRPRGAGRARERPPLDVGRARSRRRRRGARPDRRGHREGRPGRDLGTQQRRVDARAARHGEGRRDPGQRQPVLPHPRARLRREPERHADAGQRDVVQDQRLPRDDRGDGRPARHPRAGRPPRRRAQLGRPAGRRVGRLRGRPPRTVGIAGPARPDQHPVHLGHHGVPQGRDPQPPQHPQQRLPRRRGLPLHRGGPGLHPGALLPLLRDGDGQPRVHQPRRHDGDPGPRLRPGPHPACRVRRAVHLALRRADDVHRGVGAARPDVVRPGQRAHRDHGGLAVPRGDDEEAHRRRDRRDDHRLRHDRDVAGVDADPHRRLARAQGRDRRPGRPAPRGEDRRPGQRRHAAARRGGGVLHPRLLGDARLLGRPRRRPPRRSTPTAGCTPATSG